jgi:uncharacterized SAM-binding protein YcdF (DUF218 family)
MERNIKAISDFIFVSDKLSKSDIIISPGTFRIDIIKKVLEIYEQGYAKYIITTGGVANEYGITESEFQKQYLIDNGVVPKVILNETKSTNTKENAIYAREKLDLSGIAFNKVILVSKTYHSRRILMTFLPSFSESEILVIPVVDDRNITVDNWYKDKKKTEKVLEEVEKIGKYFLKGDLSL